METRIHLAFVLSLKHQSISLSLSVHFQTIQLWNSIHEHQSIKILVEKKCFQSWFKHCNSCSRSHRKWKWVPNHWSISTKRSFAVSSEPTPRHHQQPRFLGSQGSCRHIGTKKFVNIWWYSRIECVETNESNFVFNSSFHRQPVKVFIVALTLSNFDFPTTKRAALFWAFWIFFSPYKRFVVFINSQVKFRKKYFVKHFKGSGVLNPA